MLDLGCGRGKALNLMARRFPNSRFVGYDLSEEAIAFARQEAVEHRERKTSNSLRTISATSTRQPSAAAFDFVTTFDALHDQARPLAVLRGIHRTLAPDGVYLAELPPVSLDTYLSDWRPG